MSLLKALLSGMGSNDRRAAIDAMKDMGFMSDDVMLVGEDATGEMYAGSAEQFARNGFPALKKVGDDGAKNPG